MSIPKSVMKEIEEKANTFYGSDSDTGYSEGVFEIAAQFGYELAQKQHASEHATSHVDSMSPPASGREFKNKTTVEIKWDEPSDTPHWLCADNISIALHAYCTNTKFKVREVTPQDEAREKAVHGLVRACKYGVGYEPFGDVALIPRPFSEALADWEPFK